VVVVVEEEYCKDVSRSRRWWNSWRRRNNWGAQKE
jgi:hypothetical protein